MNLMFRKNFREGGGGGGGGGGKSSGSGGGSKLQTKGQRTKRSRELGGGSQGDEIHYRTHLLFAPARFGCDVSEERCSGFSSLPLSSMPRELDAPHPLVDRRPSLSLLRWNNYNSNDNDNDNDNYNYNYNYNYNNNNTIYESNFNVTPTSPIGVVSSQEFNPLLEQITNESIITSPSPPPPITTVAPDLTITGLLMNSNYAAGRQATVGDGNAVAGSAALPSACLTRAEPISLAALDRDCFIIPAHNVERFLPAGIPMPPPPITAPTAKASSPLSVLKVSDPKMCILVHLMSPLEPIDPMLESPLAHPLLKQRSVASELLSEVQQANQAIGGMLLANMEKSSEFPFISYYAINTTQTDPSTFYSGIRVSSLSKFEPKNLKYTAAHTLDLYSEVAAICRPPLVLAPSDVGGFKKTQTPATGYIISVFKVFEGDDGERFEKNWLYWTGARMLYRYLPRTAGLRRIALHKSTSTRGDKMYLLVCECADLLKDITAAAFLIPALRARLCGYTGLYRPIQAF